MPSVKPKIPQPQFPRPQTYPGGYQPPQLPPVAMWPQAPTTAQTPPFVPGNVPQVSPQGAPEEQPGMPRTQRSGIMARLSDPRLAGFLMSVGAALGQPRQFGQTGWGQAAQAMGQGYNYLAMYQAMQDQARKEQWQMQRQAQLDKASMAKTQSEITSAEAKTKQEAAELQSREKMHKEAIDFQRDDLKAKMGMSKEQLALEEKKLAAQIKEAEGRLKEMGESRKDTKEYHQGMLAIQKLQAQADNVRAAAQMQMVPSEIKKNEGMAEYYKAGGAGRGAGAEGQGDMTPAQLAELEVKWRDTWTVGGGRPGESADDYVARMKKDLLVTKPAIRDQYNQQPSGGRQPAKAPSAGPTRTPQQAAPAAPKAVPPKIGEIRDGYRYEGDKFGGGPNNPKNYTPVGQ